MSWNARFAGEDYLYGKAPAAFVAEQAWRIAPGSRMLSIAEGEGRNAAFLAGQGVVMTALEAAPNARTKARRLAQERGVTLDFIAADLRGQRQTMMRLLPATSNLPIPRFAPRFLTVSPGR